jgi:hypothetical protein
VRVGGSQTIFEVVDVACQPLDPPAELFEHVEPRLEAFDARIERARIDFFSFVSRRCTRNAQCEKNHGHHMERCASHLQRQSLEKYKARFHWPLQSRDAARGARISRKLISMGKVRFYRTLDKARSNHFGARHMKS